MRSVWESVKESDAPGWRLWRVTSSWRPSSAEEAAPLLPPDHGASCLQHALTFINPGLEGSRLLTSSRFCLRSFCSLVEVSDYPFTYSQSEKLRDPSRTACCEDFCVLVVSPTERLNCCRIRWISSCCDEIFGRAFRFAGRRACTRAVSELHFPDCH